MSFIHGLFAALSLVNFQEPSNFLVVSHYLSLSTSLCM
jgi:hypothetical protein